VYVRLTGKSGDKWVFARILTWRSYDTGLVISIQKSSDRQFTHERAHKEIDIHSNQML